MPGHILDSSFENLRHEFDTGCGQAAQRARAELLQDLNQLFRRFRGYQSENEWVQTTVDAASAYASQVALFAITNKRLELRGQMPPGLLPNDLNFPVSEARAFLNAIESKDTVTALRTPREVPAELSATSESERAHLFPITNGDRVSAVLFASDAGSDVNALELVAGIASSVLERKANAAQHAQISPAIPTAERLPKQTEKLSWSDLPPEQRQLHVRAQRFARLTVAELLQARPDAGRTGREQGDVYLFLKREIDKARENYRKQFMTVPSMVDYLHLELIQTAALGDEQKLGADYPGRLV